MEPGIPRNVLPSCLWSPRPSLPLVMVAVGSTFARPARALDPGMRITQYGTQIWSIDQGLPHAFVTDVLQTTDGYVWIATQEGVARFDGVRFVVHDKFSDEAITNQLFTSLHQDDSGTLWLGTLGGGLLSLLPEQGEWQRYTAADGLPDDRLNALCGTADGLWIATNGGGASLFADGRFTHLDVEGGLASNHVRTIHCDPDGTVWFGTLSGLTRRDAEGTLRRWDTPPLSESVIALYRARDGLWVGTRAGAARVVGEAVVETLTTADGLPGNSVWSILQDSDANLWFGTDNGLARRAKGVLDTYFERQGLAAKLVYTLYEDQEGGLWVGTWGGGVQRLHGGPITTLGQLEGLASDAVWGVTREPSGVMWVATDNGVDRIAAGEPIRNFGVQDGLPDEAINTVLASPDGGLWVGSDSGLRRLERGRVSAMRYDLPGVVALHEDRARVLWVGSYQGAARLTSGRVLPVVGTDIGVYSFLERSPNDVWLGTMRGVARWTDGALVWQPDVVGEPADWVMALHEDANGSLWVGGRNGLYRLRNGEAVAIAPRPVFGQSICQILERDGNLWLGTGRGLVRASLAELDAFADGGAPEVSSMTLGTLDGMRSRDCNGAVHPSSASSQEALWFATSGGLARLDPRLAAADERGPEPVIEGASVDHQLVVGSDIVVPAGGRNVDIRFTALTFDKPGRVDFRYRLEPFDTSWLQADTLRTAHYARLPPGRYRFLLQSRLDGGGWRNGRPVDVSVLPFLWERRSVQALAVGLAVLGLIAAYRARMARLWRERQQLHAVIEQINLAKEAAESANRVKSQFLATMSHELRTPLNAIIGYAEMLAEDLTDESSLEDIGRINASARHLLRILSDLLDLAKIEAGKMDLRFEAVSVARVVQLAAQSVQPMMRANGNTFQVHMHSGDLAVRADPGKLEQVLINLLSNAAKFCSAGQVALTVRQRPADERVWFEVTDTGVGIDAADLAKLFHPFVQVDSSPTRRFEGTGLGLVITKQLIETMGGVVEVRSTKGVGSTFAVCLPQAERAAHVSESGALPFEVAGGTPGRTAQGAQPRPAGGHPLQGRPQ